MLTQLNIRNFAIIDHLSLDFLPAFNVFTGETGAGKSIILNAANLILGARPTADLIRTGEQEMEVEAAFFVEDGNPVPGILGEWGLHPSRDIVIRRIVTKKGPNRVFINGNLLNASMLSTLGTHLMSIVGQYDQRILIQPEMHLDLLDEFAGLTAKQAEAARIFSRLQDVMNQRKALLARRERDAERLELLRFQHREIENACLHEGEDEELEAERTRLRNAETLCRTAQEGYDELYGGDQSLVERASKTQAEILKNSSFDPSLQPLAERLMSVILELEDMSFSLRDYMKNMIFEPARLEWVENRLAQMKTLGKKYGNSVAAILARQQEINGEIEEQEKRHLNVDDLDKQTAALFKELHELSCELSVKRRNCADQLARKMEEELSSLNMSKLLFKVRIDPLKAGEKETLRYGDVVLGPRGMDVASFLISPNPGEEPRPLARIASGGELSRILLALKGLLAGRGEVETLVFDEVDAGIGGETAEKIGRKLKDLSRVHQVVCITHLPQIACFADRHYLVTKHEAGNRTVTRVGILEPAARLDEIARMLGGGESLKKAREYAAELVARAEMVT